MDDLSLIIGDRQLMGWEGIRVTRGIERMPSDFDVLMTERYPGELSSFVIQDGDEVIVKLGEDRVITGYVDRFVPSIDARQHSIQVSGRGKCADLVDCAAEWPGSQISNSNALDIAAKLAQPYGISVSTDVDVGRVVPQFNLMLGETVYEIIERVSRWRALLVYDDVFGNLVLSRVGTRAAACGFQEGVNVQSASIAYSMDQRFSEVQAYRVATDTFHDLGDRGNLIGTAMDPNVPRHRRHIVVAESGDAYEEVVTARALWEIARRFGRSYQLNLTTDSWRDSEGALWTPNTLVPVSLPSLKLKQASWVISEVTYRRDEQSGTTADLVIMPREAFLVEPLLNQPFPRDVAESLGQFTSDIEESLAQFGGAR